ncbi:MAG: ATP-dependent DNA helicase RecG [Patescibacteria group bacterium]|nr:ATP-dependent DNA helicase RecG [Patescibacteria group bacterium]
MNLNSSIENLKVLTKPQIAALKKLGLNTARELLLYFPRRYLDFSKVATIRDLRPGENVSLKVTVKNISKRFSFRGRISLAEALVSDQSGSLKIIWFNQGYVADQISKGDEIFLAGSPEYYKNQLQLTNPLYEKVSDFPLHTARLVPVYRLPEKVYPKTFRRAIAAALPLTDELSDDLSADIIQRQNLLSLAQTVKLSHFPQTEEDAKQAKRRLAFEEIFYNQLLAQQYKLKLAKQQSFAIKFDQNLIKTSLSHLPFELTPGQKRAAWDILQDLEKPRPMNRLLEGDVGSGKTLVALIATLETESAGLQAVLLAPTEILANQHYQTIHKVLCRPPVNFNTRCALFTRNFCLLNNKTLERKKLGQLMAEGMPGLYVGTHALLEEKIKFKKLALVVIDEQHRFGVRQRAKLIQTKGKIPHLLSLSATPIPRTLQLAFYGELDISQIKQKPAGRKPIITKLVDAQNRNQAYNFIGNQIKAGWQAFVITPLIEESDKLGVKAAKTEVENLKKIFPNLSIGLMHGKLRGTEKDAVMKDFLDNKIQILVSTSVVEVGVDVPNASVMLIEGADRFGLAQLHQFRGRVGRAEHQSYCLLFSDNQNPETLQRLEAFTKTTDGFELAELDLKLRGFGDIYGQSQSGWNFKYFDQTYISLIEPARQEALDILQADLELDNYPGLKEKLTGKTVHFE